MPSLRRTVGADASYATDDETQANLTHRMNELEKQKREAEAMLYDLEDEEEERAEIEKELQKFEQGVEKVRPSLTDPSYMATASYEELRLALRILGLRVTVIMFCPLAPAIKGK